MLAPIYFVECDHGKLGREFRATDRNTSSWQQVVDDIYCGEIERPIKVLEVFEDEGTVRDVTEDIARDVFAKCDWDDFNALGKHAHDLRCFLETHLDLEAA